MQPNQIIQTDLVAVAFEKGDVSCVKRDGTIE
jgi:hypothetical protein